MILEPMGIPGVCPKHLRAWTNEEDGLLISLYGKKTIREIATHLPTRTKNAVGARIIRLRSLYPNVLEYTHRPYNQEEDKFIINNSRTMTAIKAASHLGRSVRSLFSRARLLGVSFYKCGDLHPCVKYPDSLAVLVCEYRDDAGLSIADIARRLGIPQHAARDLYCRRLTADYAIARQYMPQ
ncbi:AsnC family protein [Salmonella enterica]|nr:AsnC family protein [Salmonella enterica]